MKKRILSATLCALLVCQCQSTEWPPAMPIQELPAIQMKVGETKKVFMTQEEQDYLAELLEPFMESETNVVFYEKNAPIDYMSPDFLKPLGSIAPAHFRVLAACPNKVYTGELTETFTEYDFFTGEDDDIYQLTISMSPKHEHGIRVGGIAISSPTFHHSLQTIIRKEKAEREEAAKAAEGAAATTEKENATDMP